MKIKGIRIRSSLHTGDRTIGKFISILRELLQKTESTTKLTQKESKKLHFSPRNHLHPQEEVVSHNDELKKSKARGTKAGKTTMVVAALTKFGN